MPNVPNQFPNIDLPGAEYSSFAPNATIAIQGRRRKQFILASGPSLPPIPVNGLANPSSEAESPPIIGRNPPLEGDYVEAYVSDTMWAAVGMTVTWGGGTFRVNNVSPGDIDLLTLIAPPQAIPGFDAPVSGFPPAPGAKASIFPLGGGGQSSLVLESGFLPSSGIYIHFFWLLAIPTAPVVLTNAQAGLSLENPPVFSNYPLGSPAIPSASLNVPQNVLIDRDRLVVARDIFSAGAGTDLSLVAALEPATPGIARIVYTRLDGFQE